MRQKISTIKTLFIKRMLFSLLIQLFFISLVMITVRYYMKENILNNLSETLLISDEYTTDLIASDIELGENYTLQLELHDIGDMRKLDFIKFSHNPPKFSGEKSKKIARKDENYVSELSKNEFQGVTVIKYRGEKLGYIITKKQYTDHARGSISYDLFLVLVTACIAFILNFIFLFLSLKNRILRNTSQVIDAAISPSNSKNPLDLDIGEYQLLADKIIFAKNENEKLLRQKALAETAASVAHDIRSPLAVMEMHLNKIQLTNQEKNLEQLKKAVEDIRAVAKNLLHRYQNQANGAEKNNLLFEGEDELENRIVAIQPLINDIVNEKLNEWNLANVKVEKNLTGALLCLLNVPFIGLKRVLSNLLNNSFEATSGNGIIEIIATQTTDNIMISIKDNGIGIPLHLIKSVLSGKSTKHHGNGLGLSTAVKFMQQINGTLTINSAEKIGTEIILTAPLIKPPTWYPQKIWVKNDCDIICHITDPTLLIAFQKKLRPFFVNLKFYSSDFHAFNAIKLIPNNRHTILFSDSAPMNGENMLQEENIKAIKLEKTIYFYLISDNPNNLIIQKYIRENDAMLIPGSLFDAIPILEMD
ncbi:MAG TPA: HAMP domain-containing sensor histidine kinase [Gammaproteobacteria bacterium]|nr:HAMP domain-containing sensor histidine kinase [Gammaproteobacteria bacterium]